MLTNAGVSTSWYISIPISCKRYKNFFKQKDFFMRLRYFDFKKIFQTTLVFDFKFSKQVILWDFFFLYDFL
jgi:hypothetical protein